ncbi:MAG: NAD(P)/FAD-dependent oxidoreductase [Gammaproteobacteria bacterium]|nr:NAD(P)/FAD-dependent oxidoreductase [Gammaproteobacteria bacterium]MCB1880952.1 NAD(P)/FAD-dependent oxidoreductase [Gammaproteobacteria bacterium]MCB1902719.1 NAD(P)/FAD-dependent oxidoreductase [Gammaproteobacteria bacterium]
MKRVTIVGAGFAALTAVRKLRAINPRMEITLIAPSPEFTYFPGTIWIPSGLRQPEDLVIPLENFFQRTRVKYHKGSVTGLKDGGRTVVTDRGEVKNEGLIICSGGRFIKTLPGIEHVITPCEGISAAVKIRDRLRQLKSGTIAVGFSGNPKEPSAMRGGPMFEFLFGIDQSLRLDGRRKQIKLVFFTPAPTPGQRLGPKAAEGLFKEMQKRDIETHLGFKLKGFTEKSVITEGGEFDAHLILFMPGMTGNTWFDATDLPRSEGGLIRADGLCRVEGMDKVYVAGDSGSYPGPEWMPKQAHMADLQAAAAAENLNAELNGQEPSKRFHVELICIVDSQTTGSLVARTQKYNIVLPQMRVLHWLKRIFEWWYLRQYR